MALYERKDFWKNFKTLIVPEFGTMVAFCEKSGIPATTMSGYTTHARYPDITNLAKMANTLKVPVAQLLFSDPENDDAKTKEQQKTFQDITTLDEFGDIIHLYKRLPRHFQQTIYRSMMEIMTGYLTRD